MKSATAAWILVLSLPLSSLLASQEREPQQPKPRRDLTDRKSVV